MFMDAGKPGPPPMAEGIYWLLAPTAIAMATLSFIGWLGVAAQQTLVPTFAAILETCRAPSVAATSALQEAVLQAKRILPNEWAKALPLLRSYSSDALLFSFAGGAYATSLFGAGLQRAWGPVGGGLAAITLACVLGATLAGFWMMALAYAFAAIWVFVAVEALVSLFIDGERENDLAIVFPLVAPPALAVVFLAANAVF